MGSGSGDFSEVLAILKLRRYWKSYSGPYKKHERPDWINSDYHEGIEVGRAVSPLDELSGSISKKLSGLSAKEFTDRYKKEMEQHGYTYLFIDEKKTLLIYGIREETGKYEWSLEGQLIEDGNSITLNSYRY